MPGPRREIIVLCCAVAALSALLTITVESQLRSKPNEQATIAALSAQVASLDARLRREEDAEATATAKLRTFNAAPLSPLNTGKGF